MYKLTIVTKDCTPQSTIKTALLAYRYDLIDQGFSYKFVDELLDELDKAKIEEIKDENM